jgi:hypothetical protein
MRLVSVLILVGLVISGPVLGKDRKGVYSFHNQSTCGEYLDAYSRTTFTTTGFSGPYEMWGARGWFSGFISAYNILIENGKTDILGSMTTGGALKWIGSWCRDNPTKDFDDGIFALIQKLK